MEIKIYVANLGKYNEGSLVGKWLDLPADQEEISQMFVDIGLGRYDEDGEYVHGVVERDERGYESHYEEWAIHDYEAPFQISEYDSIEKVSELAERLETLNEKDEEVIEAIIGNFCSIGEGLDILESGEYTIYSNCNDMSDVAYALVEETGMLSEVPENLQGYFDYEAFGRDLAIEGTYLRVGYDTFVELRG